ncbi:MAG: 4-(cytidine 5'-diphospho)-2-C-methyl-D-erythritol kinase [Gammaproteobacteria bacterium]|nr:4-(cytidine 5'-diphospho)-2-C-methyl-D-erythritol kinase [Gammaproteobacteria bacterium]
MPGNRDRTPLQLPAPAKINRFLHVLGRRADGFHRLETLFQLLQWADRLGFGVLEQPHIRRIDRHPFHLPEADLCVRAAQLLQAACPPAAGRGVTITLTKTIPPGSGLGGGSSNAATTLLALNHLWQLGLTRARLAQLGLQLGADVPLFIYGRAALAGGVGEVLKACEPAEKWLLICVPPVEVSTARVFAHLRADGPGGDDLSDRAPNGNDLEAVTARLYPEVGQVLAWLRRHGDARMSGSGGAVYAEFNSRAEAGSAASALPDGWNGRVTRALNRHPLADFR